MTIRPAFVGALAVAMLGAAAAFGVSAVSHARDRRDDRAATAAARRLAPLDDARPSTECHGDGRVSCFTVSGSVAEASSAMARSLTVAAAKPASVRCYPIASGPAAGRQFCVVAARWGGHGVFASVEPHVLRADGKPAVRRVLVSVTVT